MNRLPEARCHRFDALTGTHRRTLAPGKRLWHYLALTPEGAALATAN